MPSWHPAALVSLIVGVAVTGTTLRATGVSSVDQGDVLFAYLALALVNAGLLFYVARFARSESALPSLLGRGWTGPSRAAGDVCLAAVTVALIVALDTAWNAVAGSAPRPHPLLPRGPLESVAWCFVALSVGFCEEVIYRGYLQQELGARAGRALAGVGLQAALFGLAHSDQGLGAALRVGCYGLVLGLVAAGRASLFPGIIAHAGLDLAAGLAGAP